MRYSGKERDASGLYDYGFRYYAPWLQRWISPDPAGDVDGLNRHGMVGNNPLNFFDDGGLMGHPVTPGTAEAAREPDRKTELDTNALFSALRFTAHIRTQEGDASSVTTSIASDAQAVTERVKLMKASKQGEFLRKYPDLMTVARLSSAAAHARFTWNKGAYFRDGHFNLPGSLKKKNTFPGVTLLPTRQRTLVIPSAFAERQPLGFYAVSNIVEMINGIKAAYLADESVLHPYTEHRIRRHIEKNNYRLPMKAGIPGLHAEVVAMNTRLNLLEPGENLKDALRDTIIFTHRLVEGKGNPLGAAFPACHNCNGILPKKIRVPTGRFSTPEPSPHSVSPASRAISPTPR